ncbi:hypothetical protein Pelo_8155 [Pelomyxa schiedti]|nr:hypothetical protein Pelo_8155 [Pelomyxa schiedti]
MRLLVKTLTGKVLTFDVPSVDTYSIEDLKSDIEESEGIGFDQVRLVYGGKLLQDEAILSDYGLSNDKEATFHLVSAGLRGRPSTLKHHKQWRIIFREAYLPPLEDENRDLVITSLQQLLAVCNDADCKTLQAQLEEVRAQENNRTLPDPGVFDFLTPLWKSASVNILFGLSGATRMRTNTCRLSLHLWHTILSLAKPMKNESVITKLTMCFKAKLKPMLPSPSRELAVSVLPKVITCAGNILTHSANSVTSLQLPATNRFVVQILSLGCYGTIAVGMGLPNYPNNKMPGWLRNSVGFHGDDGNVYHNNVIVAREWPWNPMDVIVCEKQEPNYVVLSLNGKEVTRVSFPATSELIPTIGFSSPRESVLVDLCT